MPPSDHELPSGIHVASTVSDSDMVLPPATIVYGEVLAGSAMLPSIKIVNVPMSVID